jgi:hypothetical protein
LNNQAHAHIVICRVRFRFAHRPIVATALSEPILWHLSDRQILRYSPRNFIKFCGACVDALAPLVRRFAVGLGTCALMTFSFKKFLLAVGIGLWLAGAAWGMKWMADYSLTPGVSGSPSSEWPAPEWPLAAGRFTAVVYLHPECPCSRATLEELDSILLQAGDAIETILVYADGVPGRPAEESALYRRAAMLPRSRLVADPSGADARRFAFRTSGETRLYRSDGKLVFRGGITGSRGHVGDNPGRAALLAAMRTNPGEQPVSAMPVFGCSLDGE